MHLTANQLKISFEKILMFGIFYLIKILGKFLLNQLKNKTLYLSTFYYYQSFKY